MIIKKPYGFLIKHFKIIHMLLLVPTLFLLLNFGDISEFFAQYVASNYNTFEVTVAGTYVTLLTYLAIIVMILANGIIFLLMRSKKKSSLIYGIGIIYYIILLALTVLFYSTLNSIDTHTLDATIVNFVEDVAKITPLPSYVLLVAYFIKGIGFNFKTMRFDSTLDLHVSEEDSEEIEVKINSDGYTVKRNVVHVLRELKYYILENKFVFACFGVVVVLLVGIALYMNFEVYNKKYKLYQAFVLDNFTMSVKESYITNVDYSGNIISTDSYFVALRVAIENKSGEAMAIDSSNFRLYIGDDYVYPSYDRSARFVDLGKNYQGTPIPAGTAADYVFVYELKKEQLKTQYQIRVLSALEVDAGQLTPSYKIINIRPANILKTENLGESKVGKDVLLKDTTLGNTILKIKSVKVQNTYQYQGKSCTGVKKCTTGTYSVVANSGKTLLIIEDEITWDETSPYHLYSKNNFYTDFAKLSYKYSSLIYDDEYTSKLVDVTPDILENVKVFEVSTMVNTASEIDLDLQIRNKTYTIHIKTAEK